MSEILILARVRIHEHDLPIIADYYFEVREKLSSVDGAFGLSVWRNPNDSESFLVAYEYSDLAAADRGLAAVTQVRTLANSEPAAFSPADVIRIRVEGSPKMRIYETGQGACLSMSVRIADPGYGPELLEEVGRVFDELRLLPGFLTSTFGTNDALEEEVIGIVTWANAQAFQGSLPRKSGPRELEFYTRFF